MMFVAIGPGKSNCASAHDAPVLERQWRMSSKEEGELMRVDVVAFVEEKGMQLLALAK
jgi:hypothetical protein